MPSIHKKYKRRFYVFENKWTMAATLVGVFAMGYAWVEGFRWLLFKRPNRIIKERIETEERIAREHAEKEAELLQKARNAGKL